MENVIVVAVVLVLISVEVAKTDFDPKRSLGARTLIYPVTAPTRLQFICGIGIPVEDLHFESVTSGYVLKAEYFLPETAEDFRPTELRPQNIHARSGRRIRHYNKIHNNNNNTTIELSSSFGDNFKSQHQNASIYRWIVYRGIELVLNNAGHRGRECVLRSICEHAQLPLHYDGGILSELLHIVLTPSTSLDIFGDSADMAYVAAEMHGREKGDCQMRFKGCQWSIIDKITTIFDLDE